MANQNLSAAKTAKNDEFYTQYPDIQKEINAYIEYNPDVFKGKTILLPCDDPEWSNFTKFFAQNFAAFGLKKLISTSYAVESKTYKHYQPSLFETESPLFDANKTRIKGKIFTLTADENKDGRIDINDLQWSYMEGDGDFSFLDKYCPEQFEILGATESEGKGFSNGLWDESSGTAQPLINGERKYKRLFIRFTT